MEENVQKLLTEVKSMKIQVGINSEETQKLNSLSLLSPAENCQQLKDLGFTANGLYPLQGEQQTARFEHCEFTASISSECKPVTV